MLASAFMTSHLCQIYGCTSGELCTHPTRCTRWCQIQENCDADGAGSNELTGRTMICVDHGQLADPQGQGCASKRGVSAALSKWLAVCGSAAKPALRMDWRDEHQCLSEGRLPHQGDPRDDGCDSIEHRFYRTVCNCAAMQGTKQHVLGKEQAGTTRRM